MTDNDERTNALGFYYYAVSYLEAAKMLHAANLPTIHRQVPVWFLYFHAIELFLKAFLRLQGHTVEELGKQFGHNVRGMRKQAADLGLQFMDEDLEVLAILETTDLAIQARYFKKGAFTAPTEEALERTSDSLMESVKDAIRTSGTWVR